MYIYVNHVLMERRYSLPEAFAQNSGYIFGRSCGLDCFWKYTQFQGKMRRQRKGHSWFVQACKLNCLNMFHWFSRINYCHFYHLTSRKAPPPPLLTKIRVSTPHPLKSLVNKTGVGSFGIKLGASDYSTATFQLCRQWQAVNCRLYQCMLHQHVYFNNLVALYLLKAFIFGCIYRLQVGHPHEPRYWNTDVH